MDIPWGFFSEIVWKVVSLVKKPKPNVTVEAELLFEDMGGSGNVGGTVWNLWKDIYVRLCVVNTGCATHIKDAFVSIQKNGHEALRFSPWKTIEYINYKNLSKSPELNKPLLGARIDTNDLWGPHIVLFTASKVVKGVNAMLPEGKPLLVVEVVGQRPKQLHIGKTSHN